MSAVHKFRIGQTVHYQPATRSQGAPHDTFRIIARLPQNAAGKFEYRIKHLSEPHERIVKESELRSVGRGTNGSRRPPALPLLVSPASRPPGGLQGGHL
jgi:hypothetical protein